MPKDKIYRPEEILDVPFPGEPEPVSLPGQTNPAGTFGLTTTKPKSFPTKKIAVELLSTALNTRSKKVLQEFELQDTGGFKVGTFKSGISGDLRITPNGLTARDIAGLTTFAIDGDTGDAVFKGIVQAGAVIATDIDGERILTNTLDADRIKASTIEVALDVGEGNVKIDGANKRIIINDGTNDRILIGFQSGGF